MRLCVVCMYVCMCVCMYYMYVLCMYVLYVCILYSNERMHLWMDVGIGKSMYEYVYVYTLAFMCSAILYYVDVPTNVCLLACVYTVCI